MPPRGQDRKCRLLSEVAVRHLLLERQQSPTMRRSAVGSKRPTPVVQVSHLERLRLTEAAARTLQADRTESALIPVVRHRSFSVRKRPSIVQLGSAAAQLTQRA